MEVERNETFPAIDSTGYSSFQLLDIKWAHNSCISIALSLWNNIFRLGSVTFPSIPIQQKPLFHSFCFLKKIIAIFNLVFSSFLFTLKILQNLIFTLKFTFITFIYFLLCFCSLLHSIISLFSHFTQQLLRISWFYQWVKMKHLS